MAFEVVNTSAAAGLVPGQAGFCDVLRTQGVPEPICSLLAPMSRYDPQLSDAGEAVAVRMIRFGGESWGVVSRMVPCGLDYTARQNRLAHHVVVPPSELDSCNPAALLGGYAFADQFDGVPRYLPDLADTSVAWRPAGAWAAAGLPGWDGFLAGVIVGGTGHHLVLLPQGADVRAMTAALLQYLPESLRWSLGVCTGSDASSAWPEGVRLRVLVGHATTAGAAWVPWPGEALHDLRDKPAVPVQAARHSQPQRVAERVPADRWVQLDDTPAVPPPAVAVDMDPISIQIDLRHGAAAPEMVAVRAPRPAGIRWGAVALWLIGGTFAGGLMGFILTQLPWLRGTT